MKILICLDYSSVTDKLLHYTKSLVKQVKCAEVTILHIVNETLFYITAGFDGSNSGDTGSEQKELVDFCTRYLGKGFGNSPGHNAVPVSHPNYDMLLIGGDRHQGIGARLWGGFSEQLLPANKKPLSIVS